MEFIPTSGIIENMEKKEKEYTILGIDPGTSITGYGVLRTDLYQFAALDFGCIRPPAKLPLPEKYLIIHEGIDHLLDCYPIDAIAIESQFVCKNVQSVLKLGMAKGAAMLAGTKRKIPIFEYAPRQAKLAVAGNGGADKHRVQLMIQMLLHLKELPEPEDAADALALAICHSHTIKKSHFIGNHV